MKRAFLSLLLLAAPAAARDFEAFFAPFQRAVVAGDAAAIAAATRTPFLFQGRSLDTGGVRAAVPQLFDPAVRSCFAKARVVPDEEVRLVFCQGTIFVFAETADGWRFTEIGVDD
ncbi:hypothetical protein [Sandaracinobacter sp.]|jgi:hypothetical protein|uniref:hypothetical protein n=1 Tax=Sandaracinobacter sp. TaxID=2487581 RepID=UPI0035AFA11C